MDDFSILEGFQMPDGTLVYGLTGKDVRLESRKPSGLRMTVKHMDDKQSEIRFVIDLPTKEVARMWTQMHRIRKHKRDTIGSEKANQVSDEKNAQWKKEQTIRERNKAIARMDAKVDRRLTRIQKMNRRMAFISPRRKPDDVEARRIGYILNGYKMSQELIKLKEEAARQS